MAQRTTIATMLANRSALGADEHIGLYTTFLADGNLFYYLTVVPSTESERYAPAFERVARSLRLNDAR